MHTHIIPGLHIHTRHFLLVIDNCARRCRQGACFHRWQGAFLLFLPDRKSPLELSCGSLQLCAVICHLPRRFLCLPFHRSISAFAAISSCSCSLLLSSFVYVRLRSSTLFFCPFGISLPMLVKRESHLALHASASMHAEDSLTCMFVFACACVSGSWLPVARRLCSWRTPSSR